MTRVRFSGRYCRGKGEAAAFTELEWVKSQCQEKLGFTPHPGTVNLKVDANVLSRLRRLAESRGIRLVSPSPAYCNAVCLRGRIGRGDSFIEGAAVFPQVSGYYSEVIEFLLPVEARERLGLAGGEEVQVMIWVEEEEADKNGHPRVQEGLGRRMDHF